MAITFGSQFLINTQTSQDQDDVSLAGLANGLFVAAYEGRAGARDVVDLQVFNADGSKRGAEIALLPDSANHVDPDVAAAPDATFHVAFQTISTASNKPLLNLHSDIDNNSFAIGNIGHGFGNTFNSDVSLAVRSDGGLFGVYTSSYSPVASDEPDIRGTFQVAGHPNAVGNFEDIVTSAVIGAQTRPDIAALENGLFVTVWETGSGIARRFTQVTYGPDPNNPNNPDAANTVFLDHDIIVATGSRPVVAALPGSRFVVLWYDGAAGVANRILGRLYENGATSLGDFVAATNVATSALQDRDIAVTALKNGDFVVAWTGIAGTSGTDNSGTYIDAAVFNSTVADTGLAAFTVFSSIAQAAGSLTGITAGNQFDPSLAALADGRFVLGWTDASASADDASGLAVRGRIIDTRTSAVTVDGTPGHDDYIGSLFNDTLRGFGGDDRLDGGLGNDTINGGTGGDVIVYSTGYDADIVEDFAIADSDKIDLRGLAIVHTFADVLAHATQVGNDTVIDFGGGDTLTLKLVSKANLTAGSFLLLPNTAPTITSNGGGSRAAVSMAENLTAVTTVTATDPDPGTVFKFSIVGGADAAKFKIGATTGALAFITAPNFEAPTDSDGNNSYLVQVRVSDGALTDAQEIAVSITDAVGHLRSNPGESPGSALFDTQFYLSYNPDVARAGVDALSHFSASGFHEGRDPNAFFDTAGYLGANKDVAASGVNPLDHFHQSGWKEGRDPGPDFDTTLYLLRNPDVAAAHIDPLEHFLEHGIAEGRQAFAAIGQQITGGFDAEFYLFHNPDVAAAGLDPFLHYQVAGRFEGRNPNAWFDTAGYLSHYTDVAAAGIDPLLHYQLVGWKEGRDPSAGFDTRGYLAANPDVAAAHINPLDHFLKFGIYEGRLPVNDGVFS